jgi:hypothetical protein
VRLVCWQRSLLTWQKDSNPLIGSSIQVQSRFERISSQVSHQLQPFSFSALPKHLSGGSECRIHGIQNADQHLFFFIISTFDLNPLLDIHTLSHSNLVRSIKATIIMGGCTCTSSGGSCSCPSTCGCKNGGACG